ncbi:MAG: FmdB family zinc ribbon protein [Terriglobia bacterium]
MPLYEYRCKDCGAILEKIQKFSDPPLRKCGKCGGKLEQMLSSPAIQFKGTGWYVTDYARKSSSESVKPSITSEADKTPAKTDGAKASDSKSDKSAKKPEPSAITK